MKRSYTLLAIYFSVLFCGLVTAGCIRKRSAVTVFATSPTSNSTSIAKPSAKETTFKVGGSISSVAFTPNGKMLIIATDLGRPNEPPDCDIQWRNIENGNVIRRTTQGIPPFGSALTLVFSPDSKTLAIGGGQAQDASFVNLYDAGSGKSKQSLQSDGEYVHSVAFSKNGKFLATGGGMHWGVAKIWEMHAKKPHRQLEWDDTRTIRAVAFLPNGRTVIGDGFVWDVQSGKAKAALYSAVVVISPNGRLMARTEENKNQARNIHLSNTQTGKLSYVLQGHNGAVNTAAFSPDGTLLSSGSDDKTVRLWDVKNGKLIRTLQGHKDKVTSVSFSPDGQTLASGSVDGTVKIWRIK